MSPQFAQGVAPENWRDVPLWTLVRRMERTGRANAERLSVYRDHGVVPTDSRADNFNKPSEDLSTYKYVEVGDLVLNKMKTWQGSLAVSDFAGIVSPAYYVCKLSHDISPRFAHHLLRSRPLVAAYAAASKGIRPNQWDLPYEAFQQISVWLPPINEQQRISDFLDAETARIDSLQERLISTLALINERADAVVDLALLAPDQPVKKLKHLAHVTVGIVVTPAAWYVNEGGVSALRGVNVQPGRLVEDDLIQISHAGHAAHLKSRLRPGDVVVVRTGQAGAAAVVPQHFDGANCIDLLLIQRTEGLNSHYLEYFLNSSLAKRAAAEESVGSIQAHYNVGSIKGLDIPVPPTEIQAAIVTRLDQELRRHARLRESLRKEMTLLAERRSALITAAVTGQLDVMTARGAA